jgi:cobyrinic acid a,c-diamide synthase
MLERETGLPCFGYLPPMPDCSIPSRHLGLVTAPELKELRENIRRLGLQAGQSLDLDGLLRLGHTAEPLSESLPAGNPVTAEKPRIAVARDEAFCFYYPDNLDLLERLGARLVPFSPLRDAELPATVSGLYLGGGYPELHAAVLSENGSMRESIRRAVASGLPTLAECGGFLYLQETLEDENGIAWPMANVLPGKGYRTSRLQRFGYLNLTPREDSFLLPAGESIPGHEFHYWDSTETGEACLAVKPDGRSWSCVKAGAHFFAGFPHLYFYGNPAFAARFVQAAAAFGGPRLCDD